MTDNTRGSVFYIGSYRQAAADDRCKGDAAVSLHCYDYCGIMMEIMQCEREVKVMKRMKMAAVFLMAAVMCFAVAGCKKASSDETPTGDVYSPKFSELNTDIDYVSNVLSNGDKIQILGQKYDNENYTYAQKLVTIDVKTGEQTIKDINVEKTSENQEASLQSVATYNDGFIGLVYRYTMPSEDEIDSGMYEVDDNNFSVEIYDGEFNKLSTISLDEVKKAVEDESGYFYVQNIATDKDGNVYVTYDNKLYVVDSNGAIKFNIEFDNWINGMFTSSDGQIYVQYYNEEYNSVIAPVDVNTKALGDVLENIPGSNNGSLQIYPAADGKFYVVSSTKMYLYDTATQTSEEILDWLSCDISTNRLSGFAVLDDGSIVAVSTTYDYSGEKIKTTIELATITKVPASSIKQKKSVTLALMTMDYDMQEKVIKFNRTNEEYRINIKTYVNDDFSNYEEARTQFQADVAAGTAGDFFMADGNINVDNLIAKGALADLSDMLDKDPDVSRDDFIPNILDVLSKNGKLYSIAESFSVQTLAGKVSDVGTGKSWTFKDVMELVKARPEASLMSYTTKESGINTMVQYGMDSFYNSETGECSFNSDDFIALLELCNTFPEEINYDSDSNMSTASALRTGKTLLTGIYMSDFNDIQLYEALYGEPVNFIGYPTNSGSGSVVNFENRFCVAAKSKNKDAAWAFIRQFVIPEAQSNLEWRFPINKAAFEQMITDAMKEDTDNGGIWYYDDVEVKIGALTEAQAQTARDIVYGVTSEATYDQQLLNIITEEAAYYFSGEKSASEVAGIIQSRAQLYIDENR